MFLSNARKYLLLGCFVTLFSLGCSGPVTNPIQPVATATPSEQFPFSTKEPEVYRAEIVISAGGTESKWDVARKGELSRIDFYDAGQMVRTQLRTDGVYSIDHVKKTYSVDAPSRGSVAEFSGRFFRGRDFKKFELLGRENSQARYSASDANGSASVIVTIDENVGLMVRQEFTPVPGSESPAVVYEMRGLSLEVDDSVFQLPADYRRVERSTPNE